MNQERDIGVQSSEKAILLHCAQYKAFHSVIVL